MNSVIIKKVERQQVPDLKQFLQGSIMDAIENNHSNIEELLSYANLSILVIEEETKQIVGFVSGQVNASMERFIAQKWSWKNEEDLESCKNQLRAVFSYCFKEFIKLKEIGFIEKEGKSLLGHLRGYFKHAVNKGVVCFNRSDFVTSFVVRESKMEDCDDVLALLRDHYQDNRFNEYTLAHLLEPDQIQSFSYVALASQNNATVAFIHLTREINYEKIENEFNLDLYDGLTSITGTDKSAVSVKYFYVNPSFDYCSFNILQEAFLAAYVVDYCVMSIPTSLTLSVIDFMTPVPPRRTSASSDALYIMNRFESTSTCSVKRFQSIDTAAIQEFISEYTAIGNSEKDIEGILSVYEKHSEDVFVIKYINQIVGVAVTSSIENIQDYLDQFNLEKLFYSGVDSVYEQDFIIRLIDFKLNILFDSHTKIILKSILDQTHSACMIYEETQEKVQYRVIHSHFLPVRNRRRIDFKNNLRDGEKQADDLKMNILAVTPSTVLETKSQHHRKIVLIGLTPITLGFIEYMAYDSDTYWPSISIISNTKWTSYQRFRVYFSDLELLQLGMNKFFVILDKEVQEIQRNKKQLKLSDGTIMSYDDLIISPELEFDSSVLPFEMEKLSNVTTINIRQSLSLHENQRNIVFFGNNLETFLALEECILQSKKKEAYQTDGEDEQMESIPKKFTLICPVHQNDSQNLNYPLDGQLQNAVFNYFKDANVEIIQGVRAITEINPIRFKKPEGNEDHKEAIAIENADDDNEPAEKPVKEIELPKLKYVKVEIVTGKPIMVNGVDLFVYGDAKKVPENIFKVLKDSSIAFDGKIVINKHYRTNDAFILSAGPFIKFRASDEIKEDLSRLNQREVGHKIAITLLRSLGKSDFAEDFTFKLPRIFAGSLPGGLYCINVCTPDPLSEKFGKWIQTHKEEEFKSIRIHLNQHGYIDALIYLGEQSIKTENLISLYGKHEKYLNRLISRFDDPTQNVHDLVSFLEDDTVMAVFHDRFPAFSQKIIQNIKNNPNPDVQQVLSTLQTLNLKNKLVEKNQHELLKAFEWIEGRENLDEATKNYLLESKIISKFP